MCGIVAAFSERSGAVTAEPIRRALGAIAHRGPDGQRTWVSPDGRVGLGHARLSIIDLTTGDQPLTNETERIHAIVNGELYGYQELQRQLTERGHKLRTRSDSEILLHLYEDQGVRCLGHLRGEFAFALWDDDNQLLFAGRDRFGIKPLFYAWHHGVLYLASEAKALFAAGVPARWDREALAQTFHLYLDPGRSLFEGIHQVPPGHYLLATRHHFQLARYWDLDFPRAGEKKVRDETEAILEVREALDDAVKVRMQADVPVGAYVSGGIDSCAVVGMAARHALRPIDAFTVCFGDQIFDEEAIAKAMADHVGARWHPLRLTEQQIADSLEDAIFHTEGLPANENGVWKFLLSKLVRQKGVKVVLTGEGGDEIFAGYANFRRDLLLERHRAGEAGALEEVAQLERNNRASWGTLFPKGTPLPLAAVERTLGFVPSWLEAFACIGARVRSVLDPSALAELGRRDAYQGYLNQVDVLGQLDGREVVDQALYLWAKTYLAGYLLTWLGDRAEMAHSVEGRLPLLDTRVAEAARALPTSMKIRGPVEKYALRKAAEPFVIKQVLDRRKHPFTAPPATLRPTGPLFQMIQDTLRSKEMDQVPFVDGQAVRALLDRLPTLEESERHVWNFPLMRLLGACVLQRRFRL